MSRLQSLFYGGVLLVTLIATCSFASDNSGEELPGVLTLSEGLRAATERNRLVAIASRAKDIFDADILIARSRYLPRVDASLDQTFLAYQPGARLFGGQPVRTAEKQYFSYGIEVRQTIYDFGARSAQYKAARTALDAATLNVERVKNIVALDFILAYFDFLEAGKLERVARSEVERLESHLSTARSLYEEGVITKNDLLQAEVRRSDAQQRLLTVRNLRAVISSRINTLLSRPLTRPVEAVDVKGEVLPEVDLATAWELAGQQRVELKALDDEITIAGLEEVARRSEYFPRIIALGGYSYTENRFQLHEDNWALVLGLNVNLFSGGSTKAELLKIRSRKEQLVEQKKKLLDDIRLDVERSFLDMKSARERIAVTKDAVSQAEESLRIDALRYQEGIGTSTDVLDAITLLTTAETNYYRALYELRRAHASFLYATGTDLVAAYR